MYNDILIKIELFLFRFFANHVIHLKEKQKEIKIKNDITESNNLEFIKNIHNKINEKIIDFYVCNFDLNVNFNIIENDDNDDVFFLQLYQDMFNDSKFMSLELMDAKYHTREDYSGNRR